KVVGVEQRFAVARDGRAVGGVGVLRRFGGGEILHEEADCGGRGSVVGGVKLIGDVFPEWRTGGGVGDFPETELDVAIGRDGRRSGDEVSASGVDLELGGGDEIRAALSRY